MKSILLLLIISFFIAGCSDKSPAPTVALLKETTIKALNGDTTSNSLLGNIINQKANNNNKYSRIVSDTIFADENNVFIDLMIENPYTFNNKYAVYDKNFRLLFVDQSLHGKLDKELLKKENLHFVLINESFIANDSIRVKKVSLYKIAENTVRLVYKNYYYVELGEVNYTQKITFLTEDVLKTEIYKNKQLIDRDTYEFTNNSFVSQNKRFEQIVDNIYQPDFFTAFTSKDSVKKTLKDEFYIQVNENWRSEETIPEGMNKDDFPTVKFFNDNLHAKLTILKIPLKMNTESVIDVKLNNILEGNYSVRYSDKLKDRDDKFIFQYYEYSNSKKKFLMLITIAKENFDQVKDELNEIATSFFIVE